MLHEIPQITGLLGIEVAKLPVFSSVYVRMQDLKIPVWRVPLQMSAGLYDTGRILAIEATGMDRMAASQHYENRTNYTFGAMETTVLID